MPSHQRGSEITECRVTQDDIVPRQRADSVVTITKVRKGDKVTQIVEQGVK